MKITEARDKVIEWLERLESEPFYGSITLNARPGNPYPQIMIERKETET